MNTKNSVFIATSLDGYIADKNGGLDWLYTIPNHENVDMGYTEFMSGVDALVMGRVTFETILGFNIDWPYTKPVFVLSNTLEEIPELYKDKVYLLKGTIKEILTQIYKQGYTKLYIDGGRTIRNFLKEDLIDEIIITTIPILLGGGVSLFGDLPNELKFTLIKSKTFLNQVNQNQYKRER